MKCGERPFDHWWGFLSGAAGQYDPIITQDNAALFEAELEVPKTGAEGVIGGLPHCGPTAS